jgi:hypothetical protein
MIKEQDGMVWIRLIWFSIGIRGRGLVNTVNSNSFPQNMGNFLISQATMCFLRDPHSWNSFLDIRVFCIVKLYLSIRY